MSNTNKKPEILSPSGNFDSVAAALNGGCDAVYIGGKSFNARQYADNPTDEELCGIIEKCHLCGVKVFITLNILYKQNEIQDVLDFVSKVYGYGADGLIIQDIGIFTLIKKNFPDIKLSASTQMTLHSRACADFAKKAGFDRAVLARELSIDEISAITSEKDNLEIEAFGHGALCVCYSGRCLMSSIIGRRSGNRGRCAQPCRMEYSLVKCGGRETVVKKGYLLSPKDISTANILDQIAASGIDSIKIEGRMKSPEYVSCVTSFYRKYIDKAFNGENTVDAADLRDLTQIFNRGGESHSGYYNTYAGTDMMSRSPKSSGTIIGSVTEYDRKARRCTIALTADVVGGDGIEIWTSGAHVGTNISQKAAAGEKIKIHIDGSISKGDKVYLSYDKRLADRLKNSYSKITRQQSIDISFCAKAGNPCVLEVPKYGIKLYGGSVQTAENRPMTNEDIEKRLKKTGGTPFKFNIISMDIDDNIYIPVSALNDIRRLACEKTEECILKSGKREFTAAKAEEYKPVKAEKTKISVLVCTDEQFKAAVSAHPDRIYISSTNADYTAKSAETAHNEGIELFAAVPYITRDCCTDIEKYIESIEKTNADGYLLRSYFNIKTNKRIAADYTLNIMNGYSVTAVKKLLNAESAALSPELNISELKKLAGSDTEVVMYGRLPLMTTQQCPVGLYCSGKKSGKFCSKRYNTDRYVLRDRKNTDFLIMPQCDLCYAVIYNSLPICIADKANDILSLGTNMIRLEFTDEDSCAVTNVINAYKTALKGKNADISRIGNVTRGHFYRGVE